MPSISLLLVEDHLMMRAALRLLLLGYPHLQVVAEAENCEGALALAEREQPDVVLLDIFLAEQSSIDYIPALRAQSPNTRVLMLTGAPDTALHTRAMTHGAQGVVRKEESPEVLLQAIEHVHAGHLWFGAPFDINTSAQIPHTATQTPSEGVTFGGVTSLTSREREVIQCIVEGLRNRAIAARMGVSEKTVQNHLTAIFRKLDVNDRLELAAFASRSGLLQPPSS